MLTDGTTKCICMGLQNVNLMHPQKKLSSRLITESNLTVLFQNTDRTCYKYFLPFMLYKMFSFLCFSVKFIRNEAKIHIMFEVTAEHCMAEPCIVLPLLVLPCLLLSCPALPCLALSCLALSCLVLNCPALPCPALS